ncbi:hypothetical protein HPB51_021289 [Rhipicephalus microplus]|uniref:C3H1-type domain-containing protein n=1 Tax=Rhipicephalus microplus TaxID=6941 RepID=A0A9J6F8N2_RHIMP|nr:hypothetical protein HPB51_021289 [Rhipicephalus microplus]
MRATIQPEHSDRVSLIPEKIPQESKEVQQRESELMPEVHGQRTPEGTLGGTFASTAEQGAQPTKETTIQSRSNLGDTLRVSPEELEPPPKKPRSEQSADVAPKENDARRDTSPTAITQTATKSEQSALLPYESHTKSHFTNVPSSKAPKARTEDAVSIELSELHSLDHGPVIEAVVAPDLAHSVEHAAPLSATAVPPTWVLLVTTDVGQPSGRGARWRRVLCVLVFRRPRLFHHRRRNRLSYTAGLNPRGTPRADHRLLSGYASGRCADGIQCHYGHRSAAAGAFDSNARRQSARRDPHRLASGGSISGTFDTTNRDFPARCPSQGGKLDGRGTGQE